MSAAKAWGWLMAGEKLSGRFVTAGCKALKGKAASFCECAVCDQKRLCSGFTCTVAAGWDYSPETESHTHRGQLLANWCLCAGTPKSPVGLFLLHTALNLNCCLGLGNFHAHKSNWHDILEIEILYALLQWASWGNLHILWQLLTYFQRFKSSILFTME